MRGSESAGSRKVAGFRGDSDGTRVREWGKAGRARPGPAAGGRTRGRWPSARRAAALLAAALLGPSGVVAAPTPLLHAVSVQSAVAARPAASASVREVAYAGFTVSDLERSVRFFEEVLGFEAVFRTEVEGEAYERLQGVFPLRMRVARLRLGSEAIELTEYLAPAGRPIDVAGMRSNDRTFQHVAIVVRDMDRAYARLREAGVRHVSSGPQRLPDWNPNAGGIRAFYFRDPDGHVLEIIWYPPGKGDPRWQAGGERLFLGIDHTAIVVRDTERSLAFYQDLLGLRVAGESENWGPEQERLNAVFGARLRITGLRAEGGHGVEFLDYLSPGGGRDAPPDARASDIGHWQTTLVVGDVDAVAARLREGGHLFISPGAVDLPEAELGFRRALLVRDPDGHALRLVERP